jgi:hypothetical protein
METSLNLVWLGITLATIWLWRFRWTIARRNPRNSSNAEFGAIVCALALLFPVISLSDDLHPEIAVVDSATGKRQCLVVAQDSHNHDASRISTLHPMIALVQSPLGPMQSVSGSVIFAVPLLPSTFLASPPKGRSPPSVLINLEIN